MSELKPLPQKPENIIELQPREGTLLYELVTLRARVAELEKERDEMIKAYREDTDALKAQAKHIHEMANLEAAKAKGGKP